MLRFTTGLLTFMATVVAVLILAPNVTVSDDRDAAAAEANVSVDPALMVDGFQAVAAMRVDRLLSSDLFQQSLKRHGTQRQLSQSFQKMFGLDVDQLSTIVILAGLPNADTSQFPAIGFAATLKQELTAEQWARIVQDGKESEYGDHKIWLLEHDIYDSAVILSSDRKWFFGAPEPLIKSYLDGKGASTDLGKLVATTDFSSEYTLVATIKPARPYLRELLKHFGSQSFPTVADIDALADYVETIVLHVNMIEGSVITCQFHCVDKQRADDTADLLFAMLEVAEEDFARIHSQVQVAERPRLEPRMKLYEELLDGIKIRAKDDQVTIDVPRPADFNVRIVEVLEQLDHEDRLDENREAEPVP